MFMSFEPASTGARRFFDIAEALCRAVGNAIRPGFIGAAIAMLVVRRIQRVRGLLLGLEARFLAGQARTGGSRRGFAVLADEDAALGGTEGLDGSERRHEAVRQGLPARWPHRFGWLCPLVPSYAATCAEQMRGVLAEPGMMALLAACPQAVRIVRPLCWMLGIARADYVPGERRVVAVAALPDVDLCLPAPPSVAVDEAFWSAQGVVGMGWVRFVSR